MEGKVHSIETFGTVDGPGVRLVVFLKGCPLRCLYCHNPDTWEMSGGKYVEVSEIISMYEASQAFYKNGGITVTGGEPLMQIDFVTELFKAAKDLEIHTCLDTSGATFRRENTSLLKKFDYLMELTDLVLLDIKHINSQEHKLLCSQPNEHILDFARYLDEKGIPVWIRHVVVPGITQNEKYLTQLGQFIGTLHNVKALDVLPYHDMGKVKYQQLGWDYPLEHTPPLSKEDAAAARKTILGGIRDARLSIASNLKHKEQ